MGISVFPAGGGEFVTNDFVVDMGDSSNNVIDLGRSYAAGAYDVTTASGDTSFDIYALDDDGASVGYTNDATLVTTAGFTSLVILGVSTTERITFAFSGASNDATSEGDAPGAGAYLTSITPFDLPSVDDTANVVGGNFATDVEIFFESGTVSTAAKNIVRSDSTALVVTRPDALDPELDPWDVRVSNPGVTPPTGTNAHILAGTVDAGASPVFTTTSPLDAALINQVYAATIVATDADGGITYSITAGSLPAGLSFNGATGVISGTPTGGNETFTVEALDDGGNSNSREFLLPVQLATGGTFSVVDGFNVHTFNSSDDFVALTNITGLEYIILAGGGGGADGGGAGGGGGGLLSSIDGFASGSATTALPSENVFAGTIAVTVGGGGGANANGGNTTFAGIGTAIGGGRGGKSNYNGGTGGSGGGQRLNGGVGVGTTGQGFSGGLGNGFGSHGGGGGTGGQAPQAPGGNNAGGVGGVGTHNFLDQRGWGAGGGGGDRNGVGGGSTGSDQATYAQDDTQNAVANFGGGGSGSFNRNQNAASGKVVVRY